MSPKKFLYWNLLFCTPLFWLLLTCNNVPEKSNIYADSVTIYRDEYGVPHVHGSDDGSAAFGFAYAQAEDNFFQIEDNFIRSIGRSTELLGKKAVLDDWLNRSLEIVELSIAELGQLSSQVQEICQGYAAGLNYYLETHPEIKPKLLTKFEPWYPLAFIRYLYYQRVLLQFYSRIPAQSFKKGFQEINGFPDEEVGSLHFINKKNAGEGSNSWAVNGKKSASGNPLLLINPHLSFFGTAQVYEAHIMSKSGWNFSGYTRFGFPFPYVGFGEQLGWASTDNAADLVDAYREFYEHKTDHLSYRYNCGWRKAKEWKETIRIKREGHFINQELKFMKTHHGPVTGWQDGNFLSIKMAKYKEPGWLEQWYLMTKAKDFNSFKVAAAKLDVQFGNYLYADVDGNIFYVYNGAIPKRSEKFDWSKPVDGSIPETEWQGYHPLNEIPQVLNPRSGWIQNCNGTPLLSTEFDNPPTAGFPKYMIPDVDNYRSEHSRRILSNEATFTFDSFLAKSYSTFLVAAEKELPALFAEWETANDGTKSLELEQAITTLRNWDFVSDSSSIATTLYIHWSDNKVALRSKYAKTKINILALKETIDFLKNNWNTWKVPWGDINRIQRVEADSTQDYHFNDSLPSIGVSGAPSWAGPIFTFWSNYDKDTKRRYGVGGNSYVSVIEFGPQIKAKSLHHFGSSGDPSSPHYFDQAEIYTKGKYKPVFLTLEEVKNHAIKVYKLDYLNQ